ncbi:MAG: HAMP domain-containing histidine kinase [Leptolyngbyaceae cyanobacterium MAG.088]|nr:HAMP domain-containing histidine kinase [Leptolyngbyaceae cyanobacterium MAG.088]
MDMSPHLAASYQSQDAIADIRQLCQAQIDRLSEKLSALDVWLIYWDKLENKRDMLTYRRCKLIDSKITAYVEPKRWISQDLPFLDLTPLSIDSSESQAYVCGLRQTETQYDYLLLWTKEHLSHLQKDLIEEYAQLLRQYLTLYQDNLRQQAKIQMLEEMLQQADHQLRNPLSLIRLYAENISLGAEGEPQKRQADCIRRTAETLTKNLGDLLNCGKQACLKKEDHNLLTLLQKVIALLQPQLDKKQLTLVQPDPMNIVVDGWQFEQVLQNLIDNAIHVSPTGGKITVGCHTSQDGVLITVSDQGPGLDGMNSSELFTPFYSTREGGTGLGLAIAKKIILDHQGRIEAETLPQGGAQFSIFLPC